MCLTSARLMARVRVLRRLAFGLVFNMIFDPIAKEIHEGRENERGSIGMTENGVNLRGRRTSKRRLCGGAKRVVWSGGFGMHPINAQRAAAAGTNNQLYRQACQENRRQIDVRHARDARVDEHPCA